MCLKKYNLFFIFIFFSLIYYSKNQKEYKKFYFKNTSIVNSEGYLVDGKPYGYWKSYYKNGTLKSEGNRVNFLIDGLWKFYHKNGSLKESIEYVLGAKTGYNIIYYDTLNLKKSKIKFINNVKSGKGEEYYFNKNNTLKYEYSFKDGLIHGKQYEYDSIKNNIITINTYIKGTFFKKQEINRYAINNKKAGEWFEFFEDKKIYKEYRYYNGLLNGYYKEYDKKGILIKAILYKDGVVQKEEFGNEAFIDKKLKEGFDSKTNMKTIGTYDISGRKHGFLYYLDKNNKKVRTDIYNHGTIIASGFVDKEGYRQGFWREYYPDGNIKSKGGYKDGKKIKNWEYYYKNGKIEQKGSYTSKQRPHGEWVWYYPSNTVLRREKYLNGKEDGMMEEFDKYGNIISKGNYIEGEKNGKWFYKVGDEREHGNHEAGLKSGLWIHYNENKKIFEGKYFEGDKNEAHNYYYKNGKKKRQEYYNLGIKNKTWKYYNEKGEIILLIEYKQDKIRKINGVKVI